MSADRYPTRATNAQLDLLEVMQAGAVPTLRLGIPGETINLGDQDRAWRARHGGQPVDPRTVQGLINRGLVERETKRQGTRIVYVWRLRDSHNHQPDPTG